MVVDDCQSSSVPQIAGAAKRVAVLGIKPEDKVGNLNISVSTIKIFYLMVPS